MAVKFTNNAATTLAAGINSSVTSIAVTDGSVFPTITGSDHFYVTFDDTTNKEIVKVTARSGNTLTVVRGHDNTTARAFNSGDKAELRVVAALLEDVKTDVTSTLTVDTFTGDGSTTAFTLSVAPASEDNLIVFIEGVYQNPGDFTLSGTTLTLDVAPANSRKIIVYHVAALVSGNNLTHNQFTCNGSTTAFTLGLSPIHENNTQVFLDGVYQQKTDYAVSGTTLTMDTAPANGAILEVMTFTQTEVNTLPASFVSGLTEVTAVGADHFMIFDATDSALKKSLVSDVIEQAAGISSSADATAITIDSSENVTFANNVIVPADLTVDTNTLKVDSSNNRIGINTVSPLKSLDIAGSAPYIRITDTRQSSWSAGDEFGGIEWYTEDTSANGPLVGASIYTENAQSSALPDQNLIFATAPHNDASGPSERLRISSDGNIDAGSSNTTSIRLPNGTTAQRPTGANGMLRYNTTLDVTEEYRDGAWEKLSATFDGSGGVKTTSGSYTYHTFNSSGSIAFTGSGTIDILVVAGGGGGGDNSNIRAAGGGAGGLIFISSYPVASTTYTVSVGSGGAEGASGTNSVFSYSGGTTLTALGGGVGGYNDSTDNGADGGSGGGNWYPGYTGASGTQPANTNDGSNTYNSTGFGNDGGTSGALHPYGSGGGGAGAAGGNFNATGGPVGGAGKDMSATFGTSVGENGYFAGGGGAASYPPQGDVKYDGGQGGGGRGWNNGTESEQNGTANTGGGGGAGGSGGSGIVILRYLT